ncbi:MAG: chemotaxis protein CheA [Desulfococcaceae bacterium]|nr:chemotaxis protein CheA [Desulfococcaceae bacterium]
MTRRHEKNTLHSEREKDERPDNAVEISLDDTAAMLIQIEKDDVDELRHFGEILDAVGQDMKYPEHCRNRIRKAAEEIREFTEAGQDGTVQEIPDSFISELGMIIEKTIRETEENGKEEMSDINGMSGKTKKEPENADATDYMPEDADLDLIGAFITESNDLITNAEEALLVLERNPEDMEAVSTVFRAFHNIKGTSAFFELSLMTELAHHAESLLSRVRDQEIRYEGGYPDLALRSIDMLKDLFRNLENAMGGEPFTKPEGYDTLFQLLQNPEAEGISDTFPEQGPAEDTAEKKEKSRFAEEDTELPLPEMEEEEENGEEAEEAEGTEKDAVPSPSRPEAGKPPAKPSPTVSRKSSPSGPRQHTQRSRQVVESSIRVPTDRLDRFIDMVGELVVSHSMVAQDELVVGGTYHELQKKVAHTSKIVRELQNMSMSMRMIPLKTTFRKMARLVRDLSHKFGKNVTFMTEGEDTEIDRNMVDIINDPLVHMVRNALDHGIELPEERERLDKPRYGTVHLSAYHSAGSVVVEITDDGRGLDRAVLTARAREKGLIDDDAVLSDRDAFNLIFEPGFSTAEIVSDVSGRGVGMDVVKRNIDNIRGHIEIQSRPGKGSTFKMSLPLTLAIIDGMVVRVGKEKYVIPTISIVRSVQPGTEDISTVLRRGEMLRLQGKLIPVFRLDELFQVEGGESDMTKAIAVVVENDEQQVGLLVDELIGSQQIVIKTLGETLGNIIGISGSAIMPDGKVGLILDVGGLVRLANTGN